MSNLFDQEDPSQSQLLEAQQQAIGEDLRVGIPAYVTKVESTDPPRVTVAPLVRRYGASAADPGIMGVPVAFPRSGGAALCFPVVVGNPGWLKVSDRELDGWIAGGGSKSVTAQDPRTHDLADCVFEPMDIGSLPTGAADALWLGLLSSYLKMTTAGAVTLNAAAAIDVSAILGATIEGTTTASVKATLGKLALTAAGLVALGNSATGVELVAQVIALCDVMINNKDDFVYQDPGPPIKYKLQPAVVTALNGMTGVKTLLNTIKGAL